MMPHFYKYLYFRLYQWNLTAKGNIGNGDPDFARYGAQVQLFAFIGCNLWTLLELIDLITGSKYSLSLTAFLIQYRNGTRRLGLIVIVMLFFLLIGSYKKYWIKIIEEMSAINETRKQRIVRAIGLWIFGIASAVAWYQLAILDMHS